MAASNKPMRHADEPSAVSARAFDAGVLEPVRYRRAVLGDADRPALAMRLRVPSLCCLRGPNELCASGLALLAVR